MKITLKEYLDAEKLGISRERVNGRIRDGMSKNDALTKPVSKKGELKKWIELAESNGICEETFKTRIYMHGMDKQEAATTPIKYKKDSSHWLKIALENGIKESTFKYRIYHLKWDKETAATKTIRKKEC